MAKLSSINKNNRRIKLRQTLQKKSQTKKNNYG